MAMKPESLVFEKWGESGKSFDYTSFINPTTKPISEQEIRAYMSRMQIGGKIQPFGCMIAVEEHSFRIIAYSKNAAEMLESVLDVEIEGEVRIGGDVRSLFRARGAQRLERAATAMMRNVSPRHPIVVESVSGKPFYAIVHRINGGIAIDLEPVRTGEDIGGIPLRAMSRLRGLPGGEIGLLCDVLVEEVRELTGYDRVMVYKFHEDDGHGEIVAESRRSDLEPYLGRHYPAAHICPASRFLFLRNRVRMICDCRATPVGVIEAEDLNRPLCFVGSTLKAHNGLFMASMDSISSLALAIVVNRSGNDGGSGVKLWGLVVCHHTSPHFTSSCSLPCSVRLRVSDEGIWPGD